MKQRAAFLAAISNAETEELAEQWRCSWNAHQRDYADEMKCVGSKRK